MGAKAMLNVFILIVVVYVIFGGAAVQMWGGVFRNQCYERTQIVNDVPTYPSAYRRPACSSFDTRHTLELKLLHLYSLRITRRRLMLTTSGEYASVWPCSIGLDGRKCDADQKCLPYGANPKCGFRNFDNIGYTWLQMVRALRNRRRAHDPNTAAPLLTPFLQYIIMTFDNWSEVMYGLMDNWSREAWIWFLLFSFITVFFILNLTLAVVEEAFSDEKERAEDLSRRKREKARRKKARLRAKGATAAEARVRTLSSRIT